MQAYSHIDLLWVLLCAFLVFLMQLGFALIETGMVRAKNTINVAMKNLIDSVFGMMFFWMIGFGLMFGTDFNGVLGTDSFFINGENTNQNAFFFFQVMFAATAVTIISGAVAERIRFNSYIIVAIIVTSLIYPIFGHWAWSDNGWLKQLGFVDFAGSTVVHSVGAWIGLAGTLILGPRLGKFSKGKIKYFAPSNHNFVVFGVFILFFAWFGFNAGSLLKFDPLVTKILLNTLIAGTFGGFSGWIISLINKEKLGVEIFSFGIVAGLVGITAGCDQLSTIDAAIVGFTSTIIMHLCDQVLCKKFHIDDPLSVISVHGFVGIWGTIAIAFFAPTPEDMSRIDFLGVQTLGVVTAFVFTFSCGLIMFYCLSLFKVLRVPKKYEVLGLNMSEHNAQLPWVDTIESIVKIMRTGNINAKIYEERGTEVGLVAKFFNYLLDILRKKHIELKNSNQLLKNKAEVDPLTLILNRRGLMDKLNHRNLYQNNLSLLIIDIDKFKDINDTYGHNVGDSVLTELSRLVQKSIRDNDVFARWGGEEFIVILNTREASIAETIAEKIRKQVEQHIFKHVSQITVSIGICSPRNEQQAFDEIFENADKALYQAKESGRNRVCSW